MSVDRTKLSYFSGTNYLKKDSDLSSSTDIVLTTSDASKSTTITHNLGYIPFHTVGSNLTDQTIIWATNTAPYNIHASAEITQILLMYYCTTTTLTITLINTSIAVNATRTVYWAIYRDYGSS